MWRIIVTGLALSGVVLSGSSAGADERADVQNWQSTCFAQLVLGDFSYN